MSPISPSASPRIRPARTRIYKALYANTRSMERTAALRAETEMAFGFPDDAAARLAGGTRG